MAKTVKSFEEQEKRRQATFRSASATISSKWGARLDKDGPQLDYWLALGSEDENLYPSLRGAEGVRRIFDERDIKWWQLDDFDAVEENGPTRNMASSQIACVNFVLPLAGIKNGLLSMLAAIDDDVIRVVEIVDPRFKTKSLVEFEWIGLDHAIEGKSVTTRGRCSTSVDAFLVAETQSGRRGYLLEWKYTESYDANDKGQGREGRTRRSNYKDLYGTSPTIRRGVPLNAWLHEPFYQIMRFRLLADRMVRDRELEMTEAKVVVVVPENNLAYRNGVTSPWFKKEFQNLSVADIVRKTLVDPDNAFESVSQAKLADSVREHCGEAAAAWSEYHRERYGW